MTSPHTLGRILDVAAARLVVIHDVWNGLGEHSPIAALYQLKRAPEGGLSGEGRLSSHLASERSVDVAITARATTRFLAAIANAELVEGPYRPRFEWTDDFPHIEIALHVGVGAEGQRGGIVLLYTQSQGEFHAPWGAHVRGQTWTVPGDEIGRALAALAGPLQRRTHERMMREAERSVARPSAIGAHAKRSPSRPA